MRWPRSLIPRLDASVRKWRLEALARGDDPTNIDRTHVVVSNLEAAVEADFSPYGGIPQTEAEWSALEAAIKERVAKARQQRTPGI
jgi:hypothetical protein